MWIFPIGTGVIPIPIYIHPHSCTLPLPSWSFIPIRTVFPFPLGINPIPIVISTTLPHSYRNSYTIWDHTVLPGFYWSKRQWAAAASDGPYASLHLAPDSTSALSFFTGQMPFLPPNQQHQCTEGKTVCIIKRARDDGVLDAVEPYANNLHLAPDI